MGELGKHQCSVGQCPIFPLLDILEKKWALRIMREIYKGCIHFNQLKHKMRGITAAVLSKRLKELEDAELITKNITRNSPLEIEYVLGTGAKELMDCWKMHAPREGRTNGRIGT